MSTLKELKESRGHSIIAKKLATMEFLKKGGITKKEKPEVEKAHAAIDKEIHDKFGKRQDESIDEMVHTVLPPKDAPAGMPSIIRNGETATGKAHFTFGHKPGEEKGNKAKFSSVPHAIAHFVKHGHGNVVE